MKSDRNSIHEYIKLMERIKVMSENLNVEEIFAENVFTVAKMKQRLPKKVFAEVKKVMDNGGELSIEIADVVDRKSVV